MKELFQKLTEYGVTMIVDPKPWMNRVYICFHYMLYESDPVIISMDIYDTEYTDLEGLLLDELESFMNEWIR